MAFACVTATLPSLCVVQWSMCNATSIKGGSYTGFSSYRLHVGGGGRGGGCEGGAGGGGRGGGSGGENGGGGGRGGENGGDAGGGENGGGGGENGGEGVEGMQKNEERRWRKGRRV